MTKASILLRLDLKDKESLDREAKALRISTQSLIRMKLFRAPGKIQRGTKS